MTHIVTTARRTTSPEGLRACLLEDHRENQSAGMRVACCVDADDHHGALAEWPAFERGLLEHMNAEDLYVLPRFAEIDEGEARWLRNEHAVIRQQLGELGLALELHLARKPMFDDLLARLFRHADREDDLMYAWAARTLPDRVRDAVMKRLYRR